MAGILSNITYCYRLSPCLRIVCQNNMGACFGMQGQNYNIYGTIALYFAFLLARKAERA